jgi:hypothetical protein
MARFGRGASLGLVRFFGDKSVPITTCDYSGHVCRMEDTVVQMEYRGSGLVSTGLRVHKRFADKPNPQGKVPPFKVDPKVVTGTTPDVQTFNQGLIKTLIITSPGVEYNVYDELLVKLGSEDKIYEYLGVLGYLRFEEVNQPEVTLIWPEVFLNIIVNNNTNAKLVFAAANKVVPNDYVEVMPGAKMVVSFNMTNRWSLAIAG